MTVQLNFDKVNQKRLLPLLDWLKEMGLVKSYWVSNDQKDALRYWLEKDKTGVLAQKPD